MYIETTKKLDVEMTKKLGVYGVPTPYDIMILSVATPYDIIHTYLPIISYGVATVSRID